MAALIQSLITQVDTLELLRDQIAAILLVESTAQQALALTTYQPITANPGVNTGNGTCTAVKATGTPVVGNWALVCNAAVANGGVFTLVNPSAVVISNTLTMMPGAGGVTVLSAGGLEFTLTDGAIDFAVGDSFTLPVAHYDPRLWKLRVFTERTNPWSEFLDERDKTKPDEDFPYPIVNVSFNDDAADLGTSNIIERQKFSGIFHVDCYGCGFSGNLTAGGHDPGDARSAIESQRAARLVRKILMAAHYVDLGLPGLVWRRWVETRTSANPAFDERPATHVTAMRIAFRVDFNEFSPQWEGQPLELISIQVDREQNGEVLLLADYPHTP